MGVPVAEHFELAPKTNWRTILGEAAVETFSMMAGMVVTESADQTTSVEGNVTGTVGIAGALSAIFSLRCSMRAATGIASHMLGVSAEEAEAQHRDAIGEICNIVAGHFKAKIGMGDKCMLSVPTIITGRDYRVHPFPKGERLEILLLEGEEQIAITLDIRQ